MKLCQNPYSTLGLRECLGGCIRSSDIHNTESPFPNYALECGLFYHGYFYKNVCVCLCVCVRVRVLFKLMRLGFVLNITKDRNTSFTWTKGKWFNLP